MKAKITLKALALKKAAINRKTCQKIEEN